MAWDRDLWPALSPLLDTALELEGEARRHFLASLKIESPALADALEQLLAQHERALDAQFLDLPVAMPGDAAPSLAGETVGGYTLERPLGAGGMGSVWLARRTDGRFEGSVAIKLLNLALLDSEGQARFRREGTILARLSHPSIARLLDAGVTASGQPYLVLEFVDGLRLDRYADRERLDLASRLQLFLQVADAVAHAHTHFVVHRDLKPSNILVNTDGQVKLLDFGIATLLSDSAGPESRTATTLAGRALTPEYAAPEQVTGRGVTMATDVYALGVLLYVVLVGQHPAGPGPYSPADLIKRIVDTEAPRPTDVIVKMPADDAKTVAASRGATPDKLRRQLRGDLDTIVTKALKKDPRERYASVTALSDDLRRYIQHEPIAARPDTIRYRSAKFVRRNRTAVTLATVALIAIIAGAGVAIYQARVAQRRFQEVRKLAHTFVFDMHDEIAKLEGSTKAREMMVRTGLEYLDNLSRGAEGDLELQKEIAQGYMKVGDAEGYPTKANLGHTADAITSYEKAGNIYRQLAAKNPAYLVELGKFDLEFGGLVRFTNDLKRARALDASALEILERARATQPWDGGAERAYIEAWCRIGDIDEDLGNYEQAFSEFSRCEAVARSALSKGRDPKILSLLSRADERLGTAARELGRFPEALAALDEDEAINKELLAAEPENPLRHRLLGVLHYYRMQIYYDDAGPSLGDSARALQSARLYLDAMEKMVRRDPTNTTAQLSRAIATYAVAFCLTPSDPNAAVMMARQAVGMFDAMIASGRTDYLTMSRRVRALRRLGEAQLKAGRVGEALATAREALEVERRIAAQDNGSSSDEQRSLFHVLVFAGRAYAASGDLTQGESLLLEAREKAVHRAQDRELADAVPLATAERALGEFYARQLRIDEARACYRRLNELWQSFPDANDYVQIQRSESARLLASLR
jgi:serine/threonine protein kinase/tetratricopeptide (TPR) repeat protein